MWPRNSDIKDNVSCDCKPLPAGIAADASGVVEDEGTAGWTSDRDPDGGAAQLPKSDKRTEDSDRLSHGKAGWKSDTDPGTADRASQTGAAAKDECRISPGNAGGTIKDPDKGALASVSSAGGAMDMA